MLVCFCWQIYIKVPSNCRMAKDAQGRTALDLAIAKGALADDELFLMLSAEKPPVYAAW